MGPRVEGGNNVELNKSRIRTKVRHHLCYVYIIIAEEGTNASFTLFHSALVEEPALSCRVNELFTFSVFSVDLS